MKIVIETPYGAITSVAMDEEKVAELQDALVNRFDKLQNVVLDTPSGLVFVPKETLSRGLVRFVPSKPKRKK